ncbi:MAG: YaaA family protein [Parabacteroides sp.]|nr:YaaA family protein [Parabacteroides sp.]
MQILISCAKVMSGSTQPKIEFTTEPTFQLQAYENAMQMMAYSVDELQEMLHVNREIALQNWRRFQTFHIKEGLRPAAFFYDGMVFQKLTPETFSNKELQYANDHLLICSFLYGLLRPLDRINPYRLEGNIILPNNAGKSIFDYWKPVLTDWFIKKVKADDGILIYLASNEMHNLFDWKRIRKEVMIISPEFKIEKEGKLKTIVIYTKMCRGAMTRFILKNKITYPELLKDFEYEGFRFDKGSDWLFTLK